MSDSSFFPEYDDPSPQADQAPGQDQPPGQQDQPPGQPLEAAPAPEAASAPEAEPQFGLVDVIEAFTAMRHEWRSQTRETRQLSETLQQTVANLAELEDKLVAAAATGSAASDQAGPPPQQPATARRLAEAIIEIDLNLTRAVEAATRAGGTGQPPPRSRRDPEPLQQSVRQSFDELGMMTRWFARPLLTRVQDAIDRWASQPVAEDPTSEGLKLMIARVRRLMGEQGIERVETVGEPFDAETMSAVDAIPCEDQPSGHVAEQISPAYTWQGRLIRYAEVRVAR